MTQQKKGIRERIIGGINKYGEKLVSLPEKMNDLYYDCAEKINDIFSRSYDKKKADQFIERKKYWEVAQNIEKYPTSEHTRIAQALLDHDQENILLWNLSLFKGLDLHDIAQQIEDKGKVELLVSHHNKFNQGELNQESLFEKLHKDKDLYTIINYIEAFNSLNLNHHDLVIEEISTSNYPIFYLYLNQLKGLNYSEIASLLAEKEMRFYLEQFAQKASEVKIND